MQVAAAALLFYLGSDTRQLFLPNSGSAATFHVVGAQLWKSSHSHLILQVILSDYVRPAAGGFALRPRL